MRKNLLGFSTESSGGDFLPYIKYNAVAGQLLLVERVQGLAGFENETLTLKRDSFKAVFDMYNLETGWLDFGGTVPQSNLIFTRELFDPEDNPGGKYMPPEPTPVGSWKQGVRFLIKLPKTVVVLPDSGGEVSHPVERPVREMTSNAKAFTSAVEALYFEYLEAAAAHPNQLPVCVIDGVVVVKSGQGAKSSQAYRPRFKIVSWAPRPADLIWQPRSGAPAAPASAPPGGNGGNGAQQAAPASRPATGSRPAAAPPQRTIPRSVDDDFG